MEPFFTIGHATRSLDELAGLLRANGVECLVDVRTVPRSRTNPQFNKDVMPASLAPRGLEYRHIAALGGLRGRKVDVAADVNGYWENQSFHNYADYAMTPEFRAGLEELLALGAGKRCAVMCAETVWWRCHRRIITDYLLARGFDVFHIVSSEVPEPARITPDAVAVDGHLEYPGAQRELGV
ncbi:MAG TPA: DUF488 domain-containing protein [Usitatibacter sp.]|jgi:uncharacterized protein (DUF488 family)|nr:DUF488 domain-containing protein [Usitatibacter sp.]